jgi:3-hydroxybutyryl-CoA dehydrogenase
MPMINEAIETLYNKVAGVWNWYRYEIRNGATQSLQLADFIGLDVCLAILNVMYDGTQNMLLPTS